MHRRSSHYPAYTPSSKATNDVQLKRKYWSDALIPGLLIPRRPASYCVDTRPDIYIIMFSEVVFGDGKVMPGGVFVP